MAENNDGDSGQKGAPATPARSGPATGSGAVKVGVYEQPARPTQSPLMKWLPILIGLIALAFFAYRFLAPRPATTTNETANPPITAPRGTNSGGDSTSTMNGSGSGAASSARPAASGSGGNSAEATNGGSTANPPGPAGAAQRP